MKTYFTFGQNHTHSFQGHTLDKDIVICFSGVPATKARDLMFHYFGKEWCFQYSHEDVARSNMMQHFPRGILTIHPNGQTELDPTPHF